MRRPVQAVALVGLGLLLVAIAFGARGGDRGSVLDPDGNGETGARALRLLLEQLGADVDVRHGSPSPDADAALVLRDVLTDTDHERTLRWVEDGGVLVVADEVSPLADGAVDAECPAALDDVAALVAGDGALVERDRDRDGIDGTCFGGLVRVAERGSGVVVALATPAPFTNRHLDEGDDAVLAASLLAPATGGRVAWLDGPSATGADDGPDGLLDLLTPSVRQGMVQAAVAVALWVLWRGRRLGRPVLEEQPVAVAGSELVVAVGRLLDARRRPDEAAATLRADLRRAVDARLGLAADGPLAATAAAVGARTGLDAADVAAALGDRPVTTDDELLALTADLDRIRAATLGSTT